MIKDNQKALNRLHVIMDALIVVAAYWIAYILRYKSFLTNYEMFSLYDEYGRMIYYYSLENYLRFLIIIVPMYLFIYRCFNLYTPKRARNRYTEFADLVTANCVGIILTFFITYVILNQRFVSRTYFAMFFTLNIILSFLFRLIVYRVLMLFRKKGYNLKHILIVGYSRAAERYITRLMANPEWGYSIHGILDDDTPIGTTYKGVKVIGKTDKLQELLKQNTLDEISIALRIENYSDLERIANICEKSGVHTKFIPDYHNIISSRPYMEDLDGLPVINIRNVPLSNTFNKIVKRTFDIIGSLCAITIFAIPMLIVAILIKTTSKGPLIFSQVRIGLHNKEFKMYKFRSMRLQVESQEKKAWTTANDPRVTPIGRFIRKTSIDELPQLFNVLKGDMSLIGPRPERPFFVEKFKEEIPRYMIKHQVRPGMSGWAQVNGFRGDTSIKSRIEHDLYYIENWSFRLDLKILLMTVFHGFINTNAY